MNKNLRYIIKNYVPFIDRIFNVFLKILYKKFNSNDIFQFIYEKNKWSSHESVSGLGSELQSTLEVRKELPVIISSYKIRSMLDIPCGDYYWLKDLELNIENYIGADIIKELIETNILKFEKNKTHFTVLDIKNNSLPTVDLVFVRDLFIHFSFQDIYSSLANIKKSGSKYLLTTTFTNCKKNYDIKTGGWRKVNLCVKPFYFPHPLYILNENSPEGKKYQDKSMGLWLIKDIRLL